MTDVFDIALLVGRLVFGGFFVINGINHLTKRDQMIPYAESQGVPLPGLAVVGTGLLLFLGGLSVLTGIYPLIGLAAIAAFLVGVTPVMHGFWAVDDPQAAMNEQVHFMKNAALLGAAFALMAVARPWPLAI